MIKAEIIPHLLQFKEPGGTSRGVMLTRKVWYLRLYDDQNPDHYGLGECAPLPGLSCDDMSNYDSLLQQLCTDVSRFLEEPDLLHAYPSIRFGLEMAWLDYAQGGGRHWFASDFIEGKGTIRINGLVWMGTRDKMMERMQQKLDAGFSCLKLKIGAIDFEQEFELLADLRRTFSCHDLELRVDANGAFNYKEVLHKLERLASLDIHSIEQPIKAGLWTQMGELCRQTPLPIALDEELIGVYQTENQARMLDKITPQYIILKPSLTGGFYASDKWIQLSEERNIGWWITSALESNLGLNAIAQWTYLKQNKLPQGLGTGQVFTNNLFSPLYLEGEFLKYDPIRNTCSELQLLNQNSQTCL